MLITVAMQRLLMLLDLVFWSFNAVLSSEWIAISLGRSLIYPNSNQSIQLYLSWLQTWAEDRETYWKILIVGLEIQTKNRQIISDWELNYCWIFRSAIDTWHNWKMTILTTLLCLDYYKKSKILTEWLNNMLWHSDS